MAGSSAYASWPDHPIRLIVPFAAGSSSDSIARVVASKMSEQLGQQVIVDNRAGSSTIIGTQAVARAKPDGYTLGLANTSSHVISAVVNPGLPFNPATDFVPVGMIGSSPFLLLGSRQLTVDTLAGFVALAKAKPGFLSYASAGTGTLAHLAGELFRHEANINIVHVPYHGTEQYILDLMQGRIDFSVSTIPPALAQVRQGNVRAFAIMSDKRSALLPDVPTIAEAGFPGCEAGLWTALVAPAGVSKDIVDRLSRILVSVIEDPGVQKTLIAQGVSPQYGSGEVVSAAIAAGIPKWREIATLSNVVHAQ
jgi:tripartite-type tricarboxylate transporter receptor subunit TctC